MQREQMYFLYACSAVRGNADVHVIRGEQRADLAAVASGEGDDRHLAFMCRFYCCEDVTRVAARRNREQHVVRTAEAAHLLRKNLAEIIVVRDRGERGRVGGE